MSLTKEQWFQHPAFRQELAQALENPTLRLALDIVKSYGLRSTIAVPGVDLIDYFAIQGARKDGYLEALDNLELLSKPQATRQPEKKPWDSPKPKADDDKTSAP